MYCMLLGTNVIKLAGIDAIRYRLLLGTELCKVGRHRCFHQSHAPGNRRAGRNAEVGQTGGADPSNSNSNSSSNNNSKNSSSSRSSSRNSSNRSSNKHNIIIIIIVRFAVVVVVVVAV